jgi:hypothetical protein
MLFICMDFSSRGLKEAVVNSYYSDARAHSDSLDRHFVARTICPFKVPWILSRNERLPVVNLMETLRNNLLCKAGVAICSCCIIPHFARLTYALYHFARLTYALCHFARLNYALCHFARLTYALCHFVRLTYALCHFARLTYALCHFARLTYALCHFARLTYALCHFPTPLMIPVVTFHLFMLWAICLIPTPAPAFRS